MLQIRGDNIHRVLSYRRAAETIRAVPRDLRVISSEGGLTDLSYIGKTIAAKIDEMLESGELDFYNRLKEEVPEGLVDIMHINGVGPKKAKLFWEQLDITSVDALKISTFRVSSFSLTPSARTGKVMVPFDSLAEISSTPALPLLSPGGNVIAPLGAE